MTKNEAVQVNQIYSIFKRPLFSGHLCNCINNLPALTRRIFCLSRFENLKYEEIAQEVNVSVNVVKYHIKSALSHLREELKDYLPLFLLIFFPFGK